MTRSSATAADRQCLACGVPFLGIYSLNEHTQLSWLQSGAEAGELAAVDGVWLLPGTPYRDDAAAYAAINHCVRSGIPFLGTCGGFQYACVALSRAMGGIAGAAHAESDPDGETLVITPLACSLYGERRLVEPVEGTRLAEICGSARPW